MTRVSMTLIVCLIAASSAAQSLQPAPGTAWRVAARLMIRTGGGHLEERKGFLVSDPLAGRIRFEGETADGFDARYDRITSLHYEDGAKHPDRLFNKDVEFYLTIRHSDDAGGPLVSTVRLNEADVATTLKRLEADTGLTVDRTSARRSFLGLPIRVAVGDSVSITDVTGRQLKGTITALSASSLTLAGSAGVARVFDDANVAKIRLRYRPGRAALLGFVSGAAAGGAFVTLLCASYEGCGAGDVPALLGLAAGVGGMTAGYAVALGAVAHPLSKSPEVYVRGGRAGASSSAVAVAPLLTRQRRGMVVSVTF
jgi:hypothetical protein